MAEKRDDPYGQFNYKITITPKNGKTIYGGFSDVSGLNTEITYAEYREGTDPQNRPRKIPTIYKVGDITLKRGLLGSLDIWAWVEDVRKGKMDAEATVAIVLMNEDRSNQEVATWTLEGARPSKWTGPTLSAKGTDVAMEELVLVCEDVTFT